MIHATAIIHPQAQLDATVTIGPYAIVDQGVVLGAHCRIGPHVQLTGSTTIGSFNEFHAGCVIGGPPQDFKYKEEATILQIGDHNVFREHVTIHRSNTLSEGTVIGSHNFFMVNSHVGHNSQLGNHIVLANGALLGGHVSVGDRVFISGNCLVHQFVRIGTLALMQGGAAISKDLPPFTIAHGDNAICGLNTVGLRRAGFSLQERLELKQLYHFLFRSEQIQSAKLDLARERFTSQGAQILLEFMGNSKRGVCQEAVSIRRGSPQRRGENTMQEQMNPETIASNPHDGRRIFLPSTVTRAQNLTAILLTAFFIAFVVGGGSYLRKHSGRSTTPSKPFATQTINGVTVNLFTPEGQLHLANNEVSIEFHNSSGKLVDVGKVTLAFDMNMAGMVMHDNSTVKSTGRPGRYLAKIKPDMGGEWIAKLSYSGPAGSGQTVFQVTVTR